MPQYFGMGAGGRDHLGGRKKRVKKLYLKKGADNKMGRKKEGGKKRTDLRRTGKGRGGEKGRNSGGAGYLKKKKKKKKVNEAITDKNRYKRLNDIYVCRRILYVLMLM